MNECKEIWMISQLSRDRHDEMGWNFYRLISVHVISLLQFILTKVALYKYVFSTELLLSIMLIHSFIHWCRLCNGGWLYIWTANKPSVAIWCTHINSDWSAVWSLEKGHVLYMRSSTFFEHSCVSLRRKRTILITHFRLMFTMARLYNLWLIRVKIL